MMTYLIWIALLGYGAFYTYVAILKLIKHPKMVKSFGEMKIIPYWMGTLAGIIEIIAGPALIVGIWKPAFAGIAASILVAVMIGAIIANFIGKGAKPAIAVFLLFLLPMAMLAYYFHDAALNFLAI